MQRIHDSITGKFERAVLVWLCQRTPRWVTSDMLTALGLLGAAVSFVGYWQSGRGALFLWLAVAGLVLNWFGDSLDGTIARLRQAERPKYGFFLDHIVDVFAMGLIAIGIGLSPYIQLTSGMAALLGYYALMILSMTTGLATGVIRISFNGLGPTEARLAIIAGTLWGIYLPIPRFTWMGQSLTVYDALFLIAAGAMIVMSIIEAVRTLRKLAVEDPPHR